MIMRLFETDCSIYSLIFGEDQTEIPLIPYNISHINQAHLEIPDRSVANNNTQIAYENPMVFNRKGPSYERQVLLPTIITETYDVEPLTTNDLLDLIPFLTVYYR